MIRTRATVGCCEFSAEAFMRAVSLPAFILASIGLVSASAAEPRTELTLEGGGVWQSRNTARIPNSGDGTRFSLRELQGGGGKEYLRIDGSWQLGEKHQLRALYAPYSLTRTGTPGQPLQFDGETFAAGVPTEVHYRFDSYRLTYRYRFHEGTNWTWWGGATVKVRDANIRLRQGALVEGYDNTGVVPLLNVLGYRRLTDRWTLVVDADGLWAPQGRAFDVAVKARYAVGRRLSMGLGYRTLEGGADNDKVYTFAWQHYALAELNWRF
jgi:hypothetical protein